MSIEFDEAAMGEIARDRRHQEVRDLRLACAALYGAGAYAEEVDDILTDRPVPIDPDLEWGIRELGRYRMRGEPKGD